VDNLRPRWTLRLERKIADLWVGVFWSRGSWSNPGHGDGRTLDIWICLLPVFPIHLRRTIRWDSCYGCGGPILPSAEFERHGRAGTCHVEHAGW
jgi:hypothetical protein